jgi:hypothetical protein
MGITFSSISRPAHSNDSVGDVREIQVKIIVLKSFFMLRDEPCKTLAGSKGLYAVQGHEQSEHNVDGAIMPQPGQ